MLELYGSIWPLGPEFGFGLGAWTAQGIRLGVCRTNHVATGTGLGLGAGGTVTAIASGFYVVHRN